MQANLIFAHLTPRALAIAVADLDETVADGLGTEETPIVRRAAFEALAALIGKDEAEEAVASWQRVEGIARRG